MVIWRTFLVVLLHVAGVCVCAGPLPAAQPGPAAADQVFPDPQAILDRLFGEERAEDQQALAEIEISPEEERQRGEEVVRIYLAELKRQKIRVVARGKDVDYLRALVETIRPLMENAKRYPRITIYVAQSSRCDARSLPGGTLVFFRGLLEAAESEAAVVGIVGHELAHLDRGHHLWRLRRLKLAERTFSQGGKDFSPDRFFKAGSLMMQVWTRPFRPELEAEADRDGARWAYAAGYDPRETARLFLKLRDRGKDLAVPLPSFLQSHPAAEGRHQVIMELYEKLQQEQPQQKLYVGRENLRRRIPRSQQEFKQ